MTRRRRSPPKKQRPSSKASPSLRLHPSHAELYAMGQDLRRSCSRSAHAVWKPARDRPDPLRLLQASSKGRIPRLIPIRYGRMLQSPFTFYRGAALNMAADLSRTPVSGLRVQACGDCHLLNFGGFATPERRVIADLNDMDETLPAPWEWDVKRLAASFVLAARNNGFRADLARDMALASVRSYRERMAKLSLMPALEVWYESLDMEALIPLITDKNAQTRLKKRLQKTRARNVLEHDFPQLVDAAEPRPTIKDNPPLIYHWRGGGDAQRANVQKAFAAYRESLPEYRRVLLDRFQLIDIAVKVVGVGSVGTQCFVMLLTAAEKDPLFLQVKQARPSVLEAYAGKSAYANQGQRIVVGSHLMQAASDLFLGWTQVGPGRDYYVRQLKDMKMKPLVDVYTPSVMRQYAEFCGWVLARAHARSGEPAKISGYLGRSDKFDQAIADFSIAYADQCERDHQVLKKAVQKGLLEVEIEAA